MKILIYGSTYLSAITTNYLIGNTDHEIVGYIPNENEPTVPGNMGVKCVSSDIRRDIVLSIQYDRKIQDTQNAYNVHTGLLPEWGGTDILYHTLVNKVQEQGLTFHKLTSLLDRGPIISKITYPVFPEDKMEDLYGRLALICPLFVAASLELVRKLGNKTDKCAHYKPILHRRGKINVADRKLYESTKIKLRSLFK